MSASKDFRLSVISIAQVMLGAGLFLLSMLGFFASLQGTLMWLNSDFDPARWRGILLGALIPIALCICVRNMWVMISSWAKMEWRPLIEVSLMSIVSIVIMLAVFNWNGFIA